MIVPVKAAAALTETFAGEIVLPGDSGYEAGRAVWNGSVDRRPAVIVRPTDAGEVASAVRFAREQDLEIAVRSGGHSIPGFSTCDGGIVIDLALMRGVRIDPERRIAHCNGGALLGELDDEAQAFGLVCPVGVVSHTGVAGLTLGGGMGRLQRKFGLTIDSLLGVDLVTADGRLVHSSEQENPDLFWGLRGAGSNFGIVTSFEFRLHALEGPVMHGSVLHPIERAAELAALYRNHLETGPNDLWMSFGLGLAIPEESFPPELAGGPFTQVVVLHCGTVEQAERDLAPLRAFGPPVVDSVVAKPYLVTQHLYDDALAWGHRFYMKSAFTTELADELVEASAATLSVVPEGADGGVSVWAWGGAIGEVPDEATAFTGRDAAFWVGAEIMWDDPSLDERCREWARAATAGVMPFASSGRYVNDVSEGEDGAARSVYGDATYERLVELKRAWDPDNVFHLNQNVRP